MTEQNKSKEDPKGKTPDKNEAGSNKQFNPKNLSDDDFNKIFDDPRLWEHSRFKELNNNAKDGREALKKIQELEDKKLEDQKKYKELAEKYKLQIDELQKQIAQGKVDNAIIAEAMKQGISDIDATLKLIDKSKITVDENGVVIGAEDNVKQLLESKPYLKGSTNTPDIGSGTSPSGSDNGNVKKFTLTQIQNPKFYQENREDILQAQKTGNIINDQSPNPGAGNPQA